ncbi:kelch repeat-containing protein [Candidatus Haliotispira prima]|uniref:Kelch repeat-containing protein n=1 Tax=Candidatus Haliotispira prima TaxID=3034016 RepID=A0ABY8MJV7_9SPIO|nr:kelch repeat-containing protein [Candidatus Haliotispira prima]
MTGGILTAVIFALTLALGCQDLGTTTSTNNNNNNNDNDNNDNDNNNKIRAWRQVTADAGFTPRTAHAAVGLNNDLFIIGGHLGGSATDEVWRSSDKGLTWASVASGARFSAAPKIPALALNGSIFVIGSGNGLNAKNTVWESSDRGVTWTSVATGTVSSRFTARGSHAAVVLNNKIFVIGGRLASNDAENNEVWKSADEGLTWMEVTSTGTKFTGRYNHAAVVLNSDIFVIGGETGSSSFSDEVWKSADEGLTWTEVTSTGTKFTSRYNHAALVLNNDIFVIGGETGSSSFSDEVWKSSDEGLTWTEINTTGTKFTARRNHAVAVLNGDMFLIGGFDGARKSDVWAYD